MSDSDASISVSDASIRALGGSVDGPRRERAVVGVGDVVALNSGGSRMTVTKLRQEPGANDPKAPAVAADVVWMHDGEIKHATVNLRWLTKIN